MALKLPAGNRPSNFRLGTPHLKFSPKLGVNTLGPEFAVRPSQKGIVNKPKKMKEVRQLILKYGQKHLVTIILVALAVLVARALGVLPPIVIGRVIDQIGGEGGQLYYWLGLLIVLALLKLLILPWQSRYLALVVQDMIRAASVDWSQTYYLINECH